MKLDKGQYYGTILQSTNINGLILTQSAYTPHTHLPMHYHQNPYFCFVVNGNYTEHSSGKNLACTKGDIVFHPRQYEHHNKFGNAESSCFNIEFTKHWLDKTYFADFKLNYTQSSNESNLSRAFIKILSEFNLPDSLSPLMIESLVTEALILFARDNKQNNFSPYYVNKAIKYIRESHQINLSLSELSSLLQISPGYLARCFKKAKGISIGEFVRQQRIKKAAELLKNNKDSILGIAVELGFTDQSHFTKLFKKEMGVTPRQYQLLMGHNNTKTA
jgi:AraC-like DNA-binding protein